MDDLLESPGNVYIQRLKRADGSSTQRCKPLILRPQDLSFDKRCQDRCRVRIQESVAGEDDFGRSNTRTADQYVYILSQNKDDTFRYRCREIICCVRRTNIVPTPRPSLVPVRRTFTIY